MGDERSFGSSGRISRADLTLGGMPLSFVGGYGVGATAFDTGLAAVTTASIACALLLIDGLFRNPPRGR
jgi:hypothetical protein